MSFGSQRQGSKYGSTIREYRDDPNHHDYTDTAPQPNGVDNKDLSNFEEISEQIGTNVIKINNGANELTKAMRILGTERDSIGLRDRIHERSQSTNEIIADTTKLMKRLVRTRNISQSQKFQLERLRNDFEECVKRFTELQKKAAEKVRTSKSVRPPPQPATLIDLMDDEEALIEKERREEQLLQQQEVIEEDTALILEREERIRQLEGDILDVNEIFKELGTMVNQQGEQVDSIEANIETACSRVEGGVGQLKKAEMYQKRSRKKMCFLLLLLLVVIAVLAVIIVLTLN